MVTITEEESVDDLYADAKSGMSFSELAANYRWVLDEDRTGERLQLTKKEENPRVFNTIRRMDVGAVSEPIPMLEGGYTVIKLLEKEPARVLSFEEVADEVRVDLNMEILNTAAASIEEFKKNLREKYNYQVNKEVFEAVSL
jgi:parvulin-like peptidyl-prolyl isomerase